MICPECGHEFVPLPRLTDLVKVKTTAMLDLLEEHVRSIGAEISARDLNRLIARAAENVGMYSYDMQAPRLYVQGRGAIRHALNGVGGEIRLRWVIDLAKIAEARKELSA